MQRYVAASERRNYFVTTLVADIADNFYRLMGLDKRLENLDQIIQLNQQSLEIARARKEAGPRHRAGCPAFPGRASEEFQREADHQSVDHPGREPDQLPHESLPAAGRTRFIELLRPEIHPLSVGVPSQLLQNRPDIRQAERELAAAGLDVKVARVNFFPQLVITSGVGLESLLLNHLFEPNAVVGSIAGGLVGPLVNRRAIRAQYLTANARQIAGHLQLPARHPRGLHPGDQPHDHGAELQQQHRDQEAAVEDARVRGPYSPRTSSRMPASSTSTCSSPSVTSGMRGWP